MKRCWLTAGAVGRGFRWNVALLLGPSRPGLCVPDGESTLGRWFPGGRSELLEARRRRDLQDVQRLLGADKEGVRQADGEEHEVARPRGEDLSVAAELDGSGELCEPVYVVRERRSSRSIRRWPQSW